MAKKCILMLLDGLGDRAYSCLGNKTPLGAANTPNLDRMAKMGSNGLFHPSIMGQALPSENAHFAMFGYEMDSFPGRGPLEALGAGMDMGEKDVAILAHLCCFGKRDNTFILEEGKPAIDEELAKELARAVDYFEHDNISVSFTRTHQLFGILRLKGDVSPYITDTDPIAQNRPLISPMPWNAYSNDKSAQRTAGALRAYVIHVNRTLAAHGINLNREKNGQMKIDGIVTQRAGRLKKIIPFREKNGMRGLSIASGLIYHGIGAYLGMDCLKVTDSGDAGEDFARRLNLAVDSLGDYDFIHVHTKAPDEAAHKKDPVGKKDVIESLDRGIGSALQPLLDNPDVVVMVTADHSTPSCGPLVHSGEPVPIMVCGQGVRCDRVTQYDEISAPGGALGMVRGSEFIPLVLNYTDRAKLMGLMDTPFDQPYWPGEYRPFSVDPI